MTINTSVSSELPVGRASAIIDKIERIDSLTQPLSPLAPNVPVLAVGERFLDAANTPWLSLPTAERGKPIGNISRYELMQRVIVGAKGRKLDFLVYHMRTKAM